MASYKITAPDGNSYQIEGPEGATQEQVQAEVLRQFPQAGTKAEAPRGEGDKVTSPTTPEGIMGGIFGAGQPEELDTIQKVGNVALPIAATMPVTSGIIGAGGGLAARALPQAPKLAGALGRVATSGALGAAESGSAGRGLADAGLAAAFEAGLSAVTHAKVPKLTRSLSDIAEQVTGRRGAFDKAGQSVAEAFDSIKPRIDALLKQNGLPPNARWLNVPALANQRMTLDEARRAFANAEGTTFDAARAQIHRELSNLDRTVMKATGQNPYTSIDFGKRAAKERFTPPVSSGERKAEGAYKALESPVTRAVGDRAVGQDEPVLGTGLPSGLAVPMGVEEAVGGQTLGNLARRIITR